MKRLTYEDRKVLQKHLKNGMKKRAIGRVMGFSHSVILYELKHHCGEHLPYDADRAQEIYERNQLKKGNVRKLKKNESLRAYVLEKLEDDYSPEQIAGRIRNIPEEMKEAGGYVCHETIYAYIYDEENRKEQHWKLLMRHRPKRIKQGTRKSRKGGTIKNMVSISKRPESVETRKEAGHWESDSMIFSKQKEILSVQTERKTRAVRITKCKDKTAEETKEAVTGSLGGEIETFLKSITFDRGTEGAEHEKMSEYLNADIYFCHPYCSWEKGSVENRNMFIRRYFPRHTNMSEVTDEMIYEVQEKLNNRPMKCLKYRTPNEMIFHERFGRFPPVGKKILMPEKVPRKKISESGLINA
jgi:IS30 family transposase